MKHNKCILISGISAAVLSLTINCSAFADGPSTAATGIDSQGLGLSGDGIAIGQVEPTRPGRAANPPGDSAANSHPDVEPAAVFVRDGAAVVNAHIDNHAERVAGVMISTHGTHKGVAPDASLYASATNVPLLPGQEEAAVSAQHVALQAGGNVRAINMSFGEILTGSNILDGNSLLTQFVDWSAAEHDVLYVVAGNEGTPIPVPTDNFNGMTIAYSRLSGGVFRRVDSLNTFTDDAVGDRTSIDLLAPGDNIMMPSLGGGHATDDGTSFAAPHVTGTVALLQEYGDAQIAASAPNWGGTVASGPTARRHEVMKAVLMNSADKLIDDGSVMVDGSAVPLGGLLGMTRTVLTQSGTTWLDSPAYDNSTITSQGDVPLDIEMGAGHLNARRALQQFLPGEHEADGADVPVIGWDYGGTTGTGDINKYRFDEEMTEGDFISITLAWDRKVEFANDVDVDGEYDIGDTFAAYTEDDPYADDVISDLDLYLMPSGSFNLNQAEAYSVSLEGTLEHIFFQIPETGDYEIWVHQFDNDAGPQSYGLAWWYGVAPPILTPGDFDGDGDVDGDDFLVWQASFGIDDGGDADGDGDTDGDDFLIWQSNLGTASGSGSNAVPEPTALVGGLMCACALLLASSRRAHVSTRDA